MIRGMVRGLLLRAGAVVAVGAGLLVGPPFPARAVAVPLTPGTTVTVPDNGTIVEYTIPLTIEQHVTFEITGATAATATTAILVIRPNGAVLDTVYVGSEPRQLREIFPLDGSGTYTVQVLRDLGGSGPFGMTVHVPPPLTGTLPVGVLTPVTFSTLGQHASFTLPVMTGRTGWLVLRDIALTSPLPGPPTVLAVVRRPGDPPVGFNAQPTQTLMSIPLTGPGPLTLELAVTPGSTGSLTLDLDVAQDTSQALTVGQPAAVSIASRGGRVDLTFPGVAGQRPTLTVTGALWPPPLPTMRHQVIAELIRPNGTGFQGFGLIPEGSTTASSDVLDATGTWTIRLIHVDAGTGSATMTVSTVAAPPADLASGVRTTFDSLVPGGSHRWTIRLIAGQTVGLRGDSGSMTDPATGLPVSPLADVILRRPDGSIGFESPTPLRAPGWIQTSAIVSGLWTVELTAPGRLTGRVAFTPFVVDQPAPTPIAVGVTTRATVSTPGQVRRFSVTVPSTGGVGAWLAPLGWTSGVRPAGIAGASVSLAGKLRGVATTVPLGVSTTGRVWGDTYLDPGPATLVVDGVEDTVGALTVTLSAPVARAQASTPGVRVTTSVADRGGRRKLTFTGVAGRRVAVDVTGQAWTSTLAGGARVRADVTLTTAQGVPRGTTKNLGTAATGTADLGRLPTGGTWVVLLDPVSDGLGSAAVRIRLLP